MSFIKLGELQEIQIEKLETCVAEVDPEVLENFRKLATGLKKVAPKAEDFLYFTATIIHAAESSAINDDGTAKLTKSGEPVKVGWDTSNGTYKWVTNDPSILPTKNSNLDIFPALELSRAYKKWKHKPLCVDHKSSSVDHVRGFIVDTYYDRKLMRVIALCALDKKGYPQLARQVETGVSNNVSMGTGVGKAICFDCGRVAKAEADFCQHMKYKSGYGEINIDLNPIELSIVVNGADPKATIKNIIASANAMNNYLDLKSQELNKLANMTYHASFEVNDNDSNGADKLDQKNMKFDINSSDLNDFKDEIEKAFHKLEEFKMSNNSENEVEDTNFSAFNQSSGSISMDETAQMDNGLALQTPQNERFASQKLPFNGTQDKELTKIIASMEGKLTHMKQSLDKLIKKFTITQEENMSGSNQSNTKVAYFQGAGGVNEPTPGQVKYPKDPLNEHLREKEDRQMVGQSPFPEVGDVEGMHPSPASADPSAELERKKMLARAESEERAMKRTAIVDLAKKSLENKKAYFQGAGGVNEPTPGKTKYPVDKLNEQDRLHEDKQMVGQSPFPGVGDVDGLHPSPVSADIKDELKRKEMLSRASLRARFVKASNQDGSQNRAKSAWEVFLGDKLLLTASVDDLSGGNTAIMYDTIATKDFGTKLIEKVKKEGAQEVSKLMKKAQAAPAPEATPEMAPPADMGAPAVDAGKDGSPKESAVEVAEKARDLNSDLVEIVRTLTGEQAEMGNMDQAADDSTSSEQFSSKAMKSMSKDISVMIVKEAKEVIANLTGHQEELDMITNMYNSGAVNADNKAEVEVIVQDAVNEARASIQNGFKVITAFVKYARSNQAISKRAEMEKQLEALAEGDPAMSDTQDDHSAKDTSGNDLMSLIHDTNADLDAVQGLMNEEGDEHEHNHEDDALGDLDIDGLLNEPAEKHMADDNEATITGPVDAAKQVDLAPGDTFKATASSKAGRAALRAKLAADALGKQDNGEVVDMSKAKFSDMLGQANRLADGQTELDVKPSDNLGRVETLPELNRQMMDLAKAPPKVRKDAATIQRLISEGKLSVNDLDALVAEGVDKDAVAYWKKYYGQADGGSEFASELVKEHVKAQMEQELNTFKVKLARAYELAYDMVDRGLCHREKTALSAQVEEIMKFNDDSFESLKRVVARHSLIQKQAGHMPQVGLSSDEDFAQSAVANDEYSQLASMFGNKKGTF